MKYSDYVKYAPVNLTYEEWTKQEERKLANTLDASNLIDVNYDYNGTFILEFWEEGKRIFVNVEPADHPDAMDSNLSLFASYFENDEVVKEIIRTADDKNINVIDL